MQFKINFEQILNNYLVPFIYLIITIKALFLFSILANIFITKFLKDSNIISKYSYFLSTIKEQTEFIFILMTSVLMIAIFYPKQNNLKYINDHVKLLFYLFGWILIITAKWDLFFKESIIIKQISDSLK